ncbi:hypothetical protein KR009_009259, partial [Drosophila setifemur]
MRLGIAWVTLGLCLTWNFHPHRELAQASNILGVFPYRLPSAFQVVRPLMKALTEKGHNVTMITPQDMFDDIEGVRHIRIPKLNQHIQEMIDSDQFLQFFSGKWSEVALAAAVLYNISHAVLNDDGVQRMMHNKEERFDMVMMEVNRLDALYGLAEYYNATLVGVSCLRINWMTDDLAGNSAPSVYDPVSPMGFASGNSLKSKWNNWIYITEEKLLEHLVFRPAQRRVFQKFFNYPAEKMVELRSKFNVILTNTHFSMGRVRANVPNIIEVGGIHLSEPAEPCNEELQRFMDEAEHGVIYFTMGNDILVKYLPPNMQKPLLQSFAQLKQRIVWKSELSTMPNKSENVLLIPRAPQRAILAHPNTRLMIAHGGLLTVMEGIHSGVPMLGLPVFFDHFENVQRQQLAGVAKILDSSSLSAESLTTTIRELIENPKYATKAKEMSKCFRDRPLDPLENAVWWTEYSLRHRNASLIRLNTEEIPLLQYYRLDDLLQMFLRFGFLAGWVILLIWRLIQNNRRRQRRYQQ